MNKFEDYRFMATLTGVVLVMFALLFALPSTRPVQCAQQEDAQCEVLKEKIKKPRNKAESEKRDYYCDEMKNRHCLEYNSVCGNNSGSVETKVSIEGAWKAPGLEYKYEITQTGSEFTWEVTNQPNLHETASGHFIEKNKVTAEWKNAGGGGKAEGTVITDSSGRATEISWTNGVHFIRQ